MNKNEYKRLVNGLANGKIEMTDAQKLNDRVQSAVQIAAVKSKKREEELLKQMDAKNAHTTPKLR